MPGHLEALENALHGAPLDVPAATSALLSFEARLAAWAARFPPSAPSTGPWSVAASHNALARALPPTAAFARVHTFASFRAGMLHMSWYVSQAALLKARALLSSAARAPVPTGPLTRTLSIEACALEIARDAAYCAQARFGATGRIAALVCLRHAAGAFVASGMEGEAEWCRLLVGEVRKAGVCQPPVLAA